MLPCYADSHLCRAPRRSARGRNTRRFRTKSPVDNLPIIPLFLLILHPNFMVSPMNYQVFAPTDCSATIVLPTSKSISNRALILNALCRDAIPVENLSECDDTRVMRQAFAGSGPSSTSTVPVPPCDSSPPTTPNGRAAASPSPGRTHATAPHPYSGRRPALAGGRHPLHRPRGIPPSRNLRSRVEVAANSPCPATSVRNTSRPCS